jgi:hypothetical protein
VLRPPAFSHGFTSFLWALGFGLFVWIGLLAVGIGGGAAIVYGFLVGLASFFFILLFGGPRYRRR